MASLRFGGLSDSTFFSTGSFWADNLRTDFPTFALQAPYEVPEETFGAPQPQPGINFEFQSVPPMPRIWLSDSEDRHGELIQIQRDWFALNWRKIRPEWPYDRWPARRDAFERRWRLFNEWAGQRGDQLDPNHFEVTYINHIVPMEGVWTNHSNASALFDGGLSAPTGVEITLEQTSWNAQFILGDPPVGRIRVTAIPAFIPTPEQTPIVRLEIVTRGRVASPEDPMSSLDVGRNAVVRTFMQVTSANAQEAWGVEPNEY